MRKRTWGLLLITLTQIVSCTKDEPEPLVTLTTREVEAFTQTYANSGGTLTSSEYGSISDAGVVWSIAPHPDISLPTKSDSAYLGDTNLGFKYFLAGINELTPNTTYYVRAYVTNSAGTAYGNELSFTTLPDEVPGVQTFNATNINYSSASIMGNVYHAGTADVSERGIVYGSTQNPTLANSKNVNGTGTGIFTTVLKDLTENTTYYARAYAINKGGTGYGNEVSFSTPSSVTVVTTDPNTLTSGTLTYYSATVNGKVTALSTAVITERGIVYGLNEHPTTEGSKVIKANGTGTFTAVMNGLSENTKYFARAYAVNAYGTTYGNEINLTTRVKALPTLYLGDWYDLNGIFMFTIENYEILAWQVPQSYLYGDESISLANGVYTVYGRSMGYVFSSLFSFQPGNDPESVKIGSSTSSVKSLWKVVGRNLGQVNYGPGSASLFALGTTGFWSEKNDAGEEMTWVLTETKRDDWSVYISRDDGARYQINLTTKSIFFSPTPQGTMQELYKLTKWYSW